MKPRRIVTLLILLAGCSGYSPGTTYRTQGDCQVYRDDFFFRDVVSRREKGERVGMGVLLDSMGKWGQLGGSVRVRVVEPIRGGAKVDVLDGPLSGKTCYMLSEDLDDSMKE